MPTIIDWCNRDRLKIMAGGPGSGRRSEGGDAEMLKELGDAQNKGLIHEQPGNQDPTRWGNILTESEEIDAATEGIIKRNFKMTGLGAVCRHCGAEVKHPRAAVAHLAKHHKDKLGE